jgi:uncharacterized protein (TIGR03067 family)
MRGLWIALGIVGFALSGWSRADNSRQSKEAEQEKLDGTWQLTEGEVSGTKLPANAVGAIVLVVTRDHYRVTTAEGPDEGTVRLLPDRNPKAMKIEGTKGPNKGKTMLAIYELKDDKLRVCYDLSGQAWPMEFKSKPKTQTCLAIYRKQKP